MATVGLRHGHGRHARVVIEGVRGHQRSRQRAESQHGLRGHRRATKHRAQRVRLRTLDWRLSGARVGQHHACAARRGRLDPGELHRGLRDATAREQRLCARRRRQGRCGQSRGVRRRRQRACPRHHVRRRDMQGRRPPHERGCGHGRRHDSRDVARRLRRVGPHVGQLHLERQRADPHQRGRPGERGDRHQPGSRGDRPDYLHGHPRRRRVRAGNAGRRGDDLPGASTHRGARDCT